MNSLEELLLPGVCSIARADIGSALLLFFWKMLFLVWISSGRLLSVSSLTSVEVLPAFPPCDYTTHVVRRAVAHAVQA